MAYEQKPIDEAKIRRLVREGQTKQLQQTFIARGMVSSLTSDPYDKCLFDLDTQEIKFIIANELATMREERKAIAESQRRQEIEYDEAPQSPSLSTKAKAGTLLGTLLGSFALGYVFHNPNKRWSIFKD